MGFYLHHYHQPIADIHHAGVFLAGLFVTDPSAVRFVETNLYITIIIITGFRPVVKLDTLPGGVNLRPV